MTSALRFAGHAIRAHVAVDRVVATAERSLAPDIASMLAPILAAIRDAETPAQLRAAIFDIADRPPPQSLATGLREAMARGFDIGTESGKAELDG